MSFSSDNAAITNQLPISVDLPPTYEEFMPIMSLLYKRMVAAINTKEGSLYTLQEFINFNQFFMQGNTQQFRNVYRSVFDMVNLNGGNIASGATASFAHNITNFNTPTHIYGTATTTTVRYIPLPYVSQVEPEEIQIYATATNVVIVNGTQTLTQCYIVLEYTKN